MKIRNLFSTALWASTIVLSPYVYAGANNHDATIESIACPGHDDGSVNEGLQCYSVKGWSKGNHELDCTIIVPPIDDEANHKLPLIVWANGWEQGNVLGQCTTNGYLLGLKQWAQEGYIIAAANQWSVQESDVLACAQWVADYDNDNSEENEGIPNIPVDSGKIGLVGHSQGGGAVIKAGDGKGNLNITAVLAMNPYGPSWVNPERQDGPLFIAGGRGDTTTPPDSYQKVWDAVSDAAKDKGGPGGVNAVLKKGTHNSEAWGTDDSGATLPCVDPDGEDASEKNFGAYQLAGSLWWDAQLKGNNAAKGWLIMYLNHDDWEPIQSAAFP